MRFFPDRILFVIHFLHSPERLCAVRKFRLHVGAVPGTWPGFCPHGRCHDGAIAPSELLRDAVWTSGVNINVRTVDKVPAFCNFTRVPVGEFARGLCRECRLGVETAFFFFGRIVVFFAVRCKIRIG